MLPKDIFHKHQHIGLDLDETLASTFGGMLQVAHSRGKLLTCTSIEDFVVHDIFDDPSFGVTRDEVVDIWHQYNLSISSPEETIVVPGALEGVDILTQSGLRCSIITARNGNDPIKKKMTIEWVSYHFPHIPIADLHFVNHYSDESLPKSTICKNLGITLLIDDHIDNARDMINAGLSVVLLERPWNRDIIFEHPNLYRIKNWQAIIDNLSSK